MTFSYLTTLDFSTLAVGGDLPLATLGAILLVGSAIAQAAPTPGRLVAAGRDHTVAVPTVFLYRLFTT